MDTLLEDIRIGAVTVTEHGFIEVRRDIRIMRGDTVVAGPAYHREVLEPGTGLEAQDPWIAAIAAAAWTQEVVAAHAARVAG